MKLRNFLAVTIAAAATASMAGCGTTPADNTNKNTQTASDLAYIQDKGSLTIGYTLFAPMNYLDGDELIGFETDFAKAVCDKLGVTPDFQEINWDAKEIELTSKKIDCIWNGMTITDNLKENLSISLPYMENRQVLIVKTDNVDKYTDSLDGANVVAESGSAGEELATSDEASFEGSSFTPVDSQAKALMDVASGVSDVAVIDYVMSLGSVGEGTDYENLAIIDKNYPSENYGVAFRKNSDVTAKVNEAMKELKEDGTLDEIANKYNLEKLITVE